MAKPASVLAAIRKVVYGTKEKPGKATEQGQRNAVQIELAKHGYVKLPRIQNFTDERRTVRAYVWFQAPTGGDLLLITGPSIEPTVRNAAEDEYVSATQTGVFVPAQDAVGKLVTDANAAMERAMGRVIGRQAEEPPKPKRRVSKPKPAPAPRPAPKAKAPPRKPMRQTAVTYDELVRAINRVSQTGDEATALELIARASDKVLKKAVDNEYGKGYATRQRRSVRDLAEEIVYGNYNYFQDYGPDEPGIRPDELPPEPEPEPEPWMGVPSPWKDTQGLPPALPVERLTRRPGPTEGEWYAPGTVPKPAPAPAPAANDAAEFAALLRDAIAAAMSANG